ncbi:cell division protein FtsA [Caproiciproducens galactitolivorans]|uniref:Cell division protein FtsA n=1 Tax=Caproiciproducens galactitolivorans TaxID=642589 RepID=A0ABT4BRU8_9FIRM|nr:cell division protein FtsA [Caproiciproducens galactitolivorans]MCY1713604.1 cell division protein FtsA [Caproiciproducens galactitolivorans]
MQKEKQKKQNTAAGETPENYVFALDIGTRSVIGVVGVMDGEMLRISAVETVEHPKRAMIDGQIEDIEQVSRIAGLAKSRLEKRLGYPLRHVCVAAAGRALRTQKASYEMELKPSQSIDEEMICRLEAGAIEAAEQQFAPETGEENQPVFYLVGYSVVQYYLDDYPISNLLEHRGQRISVEVIATFLPREVVDSLYTTMHKTGLEVASLTLEPIAAMNAAIPQKLRLLNLALVDIGAGTSDIAISKDGGVVGYTMATIAGDEITEAIMKKYLVDFTTAEDIKMKMSGESEISFKDILGLEHTVTPEEVKQETEPVKRILCKEICDRITEANGGAPSAVFLVGGGSKLPGLCECVSEYLKLPASRVAIGGNNFLMHVSSSDEDVTGPEFATPLGIAVSAALNLINDSFSIRLNGSRAKLFRSGKLTILDVLLMNGYTYNQLISRSGQSIIIDLNGEKKVLYGGHPSAARILLNGAESSITALIKAGDEIVFEPAVPGENANPSLEDVVHFQAPCKVLFNGMEVEIGTRATVNGQPAEPEQPLCARDKVRTYSIGTLRELLKFLGEDEEQAFIINGKPVKPDTALCKGDRIEYAKTDAEAQPAKPEPQPEAKPAQETDAEPPENKVHITLNHAPLSLKPKPDKTPYRLIDMLNLVDIDLSKPQGNIVLHVNGQDAAYLQTLADGDYVDIYWEKRQ